MSPCPRVLYFRDYTYLYVRVVSVPVLVVMLHRPYLLKILSWIPFSPSINAEYGFCRLLLMVLARCHGNLTNLINFSNVCLDELILDK